MFKFNRKILSLENEKENKDNEPSSNDIKELNSLLDIHRNRVVFLQKLNEHRAKGKFELKNKTFEILGKLFDTVIIQFKEIMIFIQLKIQ